jgi:3-oxoadipate enol-lactonase
MGGLIGLWLGIHAADRIERLVLSNTTARIGTPASWNERIAAVERAGLAPLADAALARWFTAPFRAAHPAEVERIRRMLLATPAAGYAACCAALRDCDLRALAARVRAPTLVISGEADVSTPADDGRALAARIPGARFTALPAAHVSNVEAAEAYTAAVAQHLDG